MKYDRKNKNIKGISIQIQIHMANAVDIFVPYKIPTLFHT